MLGTLATAETAVAEKFVTTAGAAAASAYFWRAKF